MVQTNTEAQQPAGQLAPVLRILESFQYDPGKLVTILQAIQHEYRYLPREAMSCVADALGIPPAQVFGVATFYADFALEPKGKYLIRVCNGTACYIKGSMNILEAVVPRLDLPKGKKTTKDLMFTLEPVSCVGACALAPVVMINENVHGQVTPESTCAVIDQIAREEAQ